MTSPAAARHSHPTYPRLQRSLPVLVRSPTEVQIGVDQAPALVLAGVHPRLADILLRLDGHHALAELQAEARRLGIPESQLSWCLETLHAAGLLTERSPDVPGKAAGERYRVRLVGAGRLGSSVVRVLSTMPLADLYVIDNTPPDRSLYPAPSACGSQAEALVAALEPTSSVSLRVANHWSKPEEIAPDLTIVACDQVECDRVVADGLLRADQPHLFVRAGGGGVVVGPFVVPGRTACLHCTDLARRDADPQWPVLLAQLARARTGLPAAQSAWAGAVAVAQAVAFLSGAEPETFGATIELSVKDYLTRWRAWAMHPECGCGWGTLAEWGP